MQARHRLRLVHVRGFDVEDAAVPVLASHAASGGRVHPFRQRSALDLPAKREKGWKAVNPEG